MIGTGLPYTYDEYLSLTRGQRQAIVAENNRAAEKMRRR